MKLIYFVSITICSISIETTRAQQQNFNGFPQPKSIRDNSGYFQQEIHYPGGASGNAIGHHHQPQAVVHRHEHVNPIQIPAPILYNHVNHSPVPVNYSPLPVTASVPLKQQPIVVDIPEDEQILDASVVRSVPNRHKLVAAMAQVQTTIRPRTTTEPETSEELEDQAKSAYYKFGTSIHDTINDHEHVRQEVREGLALKGMYSYSDGFFRRTVHYEADEGGYRVVKEEIEPIGDGEGPKFNPKGQAAVKSTLTGDYSITVDDFRLNKKQEEQVAKQNV